MVFSLKLIISVPIVTDPGASQPTVDSTLILSPVEAVPVRVSLSLVFVDTANSPLTVSGARTML